MTSDLSQLGFLLFVSACGSVFVAVVAIALVTLGRAVAIYPVCALFARGRLKVDLRHQHVLFWAGLRRCCIAWRKSNSRGESAFASACRSSPKAIARETLRYKV